MCNKFSHIWFFFVLNKIPIKCGSTKTSVLQAFTVRIQEKYLWIYESLIPSELETLKQIIEFIFSNNNLAVWNNLISIKYDFVLIPCMIDLSLVTHFPKKTFEVLCLIFLGRLWFSWNGLLNFLSSHFWFLVFPFLNSTDLWSFYSEFQCSQPLFLNMNKKNWLRS